jgi:phosphonate metabolism protein (transferase hexapeptide repeat family)
MIHKKNDLMAIELNQNEIKAGAGGPNPVIHPSATIRQSVIGDYTDVGPNWTVIESKLGDYSYLAGSDGQVIYAEIGRFCSIASHVAINPGDHPMQRVIQHHCTYRRRRYGFADTDDEAFFEWRRRQKCTIGHDVWIGTAAKIMAGVTVATGAVIAAGAVVTRDIESYQVVAGVPARPLRMRFPPDIVAKLLRTEWWDWNRSTLEERYVDFYSIESFIEKYA